MCGSSATQEHVIALIAEALEISAEELSQESTSRDCSAWDSMGVLNIIVMLAKHGIEVGPDLSDRCESVRDICSLFEERGQLR